MQTTCEIPQWFTDLMVGQLIEVRDDGMVWIDSLGIGFHPQFDPARYDGAYFDKYAVMDSTEMGYLLNEQRAVFVRGHYTGPVLDFGIGAGAFLKEMWKHPSSAGSAGFDINEHALAWLRGNGSLRDPYNGVPKAAMTFWDSLEHAPDIAPLLANVTGWVFVSMPIVMEEHGGPLPTWRHYRPGEHLLYATAWGLAGLMRSFGFDLVEQDLFETRLGRQDIGSFAFRRIKR